MKKSKIVLLLVLCLMFLAACSPTAKKSLSLDIQGLLDQMEEQSDWEGMMKIGNKHLSNLYAIEVDDLQSFSGLMKTDGITADEIIVIEAKDQKDAEGLQKKLQARLKAKAAEAKDYLPEQYKVIEEAVILVKEKYLALIVAPNVAELEKLWNEATKTDK